MVTFREALNDVIRSQACATALLGNNAFSLAADLQDRTVLGGPIVPIQRQIAEGLSGLADVFCNRPPTTPPPQPQFTGGQCPGTRYRVVIDYTNSDGIGQQIDPTEEGPIGDVGVGLNRFDIYTITFSTGTGPFSQSIGGSPPQTEPTIDSVNPIAVDGPDDCGDPPPPTPPIPPVIPPGIPDDVTFDDDTGTSVTVPVVLFFGFAYINANADINIPVRINVDAQFDLFADINLNVGEINFNFGNRQPNTDGPCTPPPIESIPDPPEDEETTVSRIIAVRVTISNIQPNSPVSTIFQTGGNPNILVPDAGLLNFLVETGGPGTTPAWTNDFRVKSTDSVIYAPSPYGALRVRATPRPGVAFTLRSIRAQVNESSFPT